MKSTFKVLLIVLLAIIAVTGIDFYQNSRVKVFPRRPNTSIKLQESQLYWDLVQGSDNPDWSRLDGTLQYIESEYDCADFRLVNLIRLLYDYGDQIPLVHKDRIEEVLFNFRYWLDDPGENSMCYWSENHQILFGSAEYLVGQLYPDKIFPGSGLRGEEHMQKARVRILDWLKMRWDYGFTEYYSSVYYKEDIGALINLIDYAENQEIAKKSTIIMDLLFYDVATQSSQNMFISTSGRAYQGNRKGGPGATLGGLTDYYWGDGDEIGPGMMYGMMVTDKYQVPQVLKEIALDSSEVIIKQSNGLDLIDLQTEGFDGLDSRSLMMQWGMEAFVNPEVVSNSLSHIRNYRMFSNEFLAGFNVLNYTLLKFLRLEPMVVRKLNPQYQGTAIQKGNTYTYRTKEYTMYTSQNHQPGTFGDQQHVFGMNVGNHFAIFHCHPAVEKEVELQSPNYWVGYGRFPHSVQHEHINLSIYSIPEEKGMMEYDLLDYTHAYFPSDQFDSTVLVGNYIFGQKGDTYCALIGTNDFTFREDSQDDLIQKGKTVFWITEAGSASQDGSFELFIDRIQSNVVNFDSEKLELMYESSDAKLTLTFTGDFKVNRQIIDTEYNRFDSPYLQSEAKAERLEISHNGQKLFLDFENMVREF